MYCIETSGLRHRFPGAGSVVNGLDLQVPVGSIYGFLGPNGAGKTTTLRLLLGLLRKQQGEITLFGKPFAANRLTILSRVGSLIESPSFYSQLTAVENLRVLQRVYRCPEGRIPRVLELTGLGDTGKKKAGRFSLGMKQKLGIAIALLHDPELLILDEPTNGLDPEGIIGMRELFRKLNSQGVTILLSSHLLAEMERLITHAGILHQGRLLFQGTLDQLREGRSEADLETVFIQLTKTRA
jgi:ABC-2 type transport system ATP-binding protein